MYMNTYKYKVFAYMGGGGGGKRFTGIYLLEKSSYINNSGEYLVSNFI